MAVYDEANALSEPEYAGVADAAVDAVSNRIISGTAIYAAAVDPDNYAGLDADRAQYSTTTA